MRNAQEAFRAADAAAGRATRSYARALAQAHRRPRLDLEAAYVADLRAQARAAHALKRMLQE